MHTIHGQNWFQGTSDRSGVLSAICFSVPSLLFLVTSWKYRSISLGCTVFLFTSACVNHYSRSCFLLNVFELRLLMTHNHYCNKLSKPTFTLSFTHGSESSAIYSRCGQTSRREIGGQGGLSSTQLIPQRSLPNLPMHKNKSRIG